MRRVLGKMVATASMCVALISSGCFSNSNPNGWSAGQLAGDAAAGDAAAGDAAAGDAAAGDASAKPQVNVVGAACSEPNAQGCGVADSLICEPATMTWKTAAACANNELCIATSASIYHRDKGDNLCCDARPSFDCQKRCESDVKLQKSLGEFNNGSLAQVAAALTGCEENDAKCVCALFGKNGPGFCRFACHKADDPTNSLDDYSLRDRKFVDVQVVSAFPAQIGSDGKITRACGRSLDATTKPTPNGLEITVNLVSTELKSSRCAVDRDQSVKEGELVDLRRVTSLGAKATMRAKDVKMNLSCAQPRGPASMNETCATAIKAMAISPSSLRYKAVAPRCDPTMPNSRLNIALLMDQSGSISGFVDKDTFKEDVMGKLRTVDPLVPSDKFNSRIIAAERFVESLNDQDRLIGYYFNEKVGVAVAADDNITCVGGSAKGKRCVADKDCPGGDGCYSGGAAAGDTFQELSLKDQQTKAFGAQPRHRKYLLTGLETKVKYGGQGRSNLWDAIDVAYTHLTAQKVAGPRHIVVVTDGPENCTDSENFVYVGSDGRCRSPCQQAKQSFAELRQRMHADKNPVILHFIHFQSIGTKRPDAAMQELACRTGGTYQFLNSQEMNTNDAQAISAALIRATTRVRYALAGSWRVGVKLQAMKKATDATKATAVKVGQMFAASGSILFENALFPSLKTVSAVSTSWKFGVLASKEDRRLLLRRGCTSHAACGGTSDCGANHCTVAGICVTAEAPDRRPCGAAGSGRVCCKGACSKGCATACKP